MLYIFFPPLDTFVFYEFVGVNKTYRVLIFRNIHQHLNICQQKYTFSIAGELAPLGYNVALGIHFTYIQASKSRLLCFEIGCFVQKTIPFDFSIGNSAVRKQYTEIQGLTASDVKHFGVGKVAIDKQRNILLIHRNKDQHGNPQYDRVNVYSKI
jgi:hypothetical protein